MILVGHKTVLAGEDETLSGVRTAAPGRDRGRAAVRTDLLEAGHVLAVRTPGLVGAAGPGGNRGHGAVLTVNYHAVLALTLPHYGH